MTLRKWLSNNLQTETRNDELTVTVIHPTGERCEECGTTHSEAISESIPVDVLADRYGVNPAESTSPKTDLIDAAVAADTGHERFFKQL